MQNCVVRLERNPVLDKMAIDVYGRRSLRLAAKENLDMKATSTKQDPKKLALKLTPTPRKTTKSSDTLNASNVCANVGVKPILKGAHSLRNRSKSVSFDLPSLDDSDETSNKSIHAGSRKRTKSVSYGENSMQVKSARRSLFQQNATPLRSALDTATNNGGNNVSISSLPDDNAPMNVTTSNNSECAPVVGSNNNPTDVNNCSSGRANNIDASTSNTDSVDTSSGQILQYQNRIDGLVQSNQVKINRIKQLIAERDAYATQIEGLHRINLSLTKTVDAFRANDENIPPLNENLAIEAKQQKNKIEALHAQIEGMKAENKMLKECLSTHSSQILSEHNYNL